MTGAHVGKVERQVRALLDSRSAADAPDGQLLERFTARREEAAFAALVRRHGPLVLGVCRRILGHEQDAVDAFQANRGECRPAPPPGLSAGPCSR